MKWSRSSKQRGAIAALIVLALAIPAMLASRTFFLNFWRFVLPLLLSGMVFILAGSFFQLLQERKRLAALPGIDYPFASMSVQAALYLYFFLIFTGAYFSLCLDPSGLIYKLIFSAPNFFIFVAALAAVAGSCGQLIRSEEDGHFVYRDSLSPSRFSRQDIFYSQMGSFDDGFILGTKDFRLSQVEKVNIREKAIVLGGHEEAGDYLLQIYTPRIRKFLLKKLQESGKLDTGEENTAS